MFKTFKNDWLFNEFNENKNTTTMSLRFNDE